jgi:hypothetical protein
MKDTNDDKALGSVSVEVPAAETAKEKQAKRPRKKAAKGVSKRKPDHRAPILNADSRKSLAKGLADYVRTDPRMMEILETTFDAATSRGKDPACLFTSAEIVDARRQLTKLALDPELISEGRGATAAIQINITGIGTDKPAVVDGEWEVSDED